MYLGYIDCIKKTFLNRLLTLPLSVLLVTLLPTSSPIYSLFQLVHRLSLLGDQTTSLCDFISSMEHKRRIELVILGAIRTHGDRGFQAF